MHNAVRWPIAVLSVLAPSAAPAGISTTTRALSYPFVNGSILVGFQPTPLEASASGRATVRGEDGRMRIHAHFWNLAPASRFGPEYLTYVLWAVSTAGRAINLGEVVPVGGKAHVEAMTSLPTFGLVLSAEPYFAVTRISHALVLENLPLRGLGTGGEVEARFERLGREAYAMDDPAPPREDRRVSPYVRQARNAVRIARLDQAEAFAPVEYLMAKGQVEHLNSLGEGRLGTRDAMLVARRAVQQAEEARILAVDKREAQARLRERELTDAALTKAEAAVQEAEAAKAKAAQEATNAQRAQRAASEAARKVTEVQLEVRRKLQERLNSLLQTRETPEGLQATLTDVAFPTGRSALSPPGPAEPLQGRRHPPGPSGPPDPAPGPHGRHREQGLQRTALPAPRGGRAGLPGPAGPARREPLRPGRERRQPHRSG